ncbi:MAG: hypothetical protein E7617_02470 [Ruminococcaceae bacterium]|nr:hypothetical protein [Oscillospiraceae bacterium]MBE6696865.1 hypothetical protein [Oscillospiraceae bacterium]
MEIQEKKKNPELAAIIAFAIMAFIKLVYLIEGMIFFAGKKIPDFRINYDILFYFTNRLELKGYLCECIYSIVLFAAVILLLLRKKRGLMLPGVIYLLALKTVVGAYKAIVVCMNIPSARVPVMLDGISAALVNMAIIAVLAVWLLSLLSEALDIEKLVQKRELLAKMHKIIFIVLSAFTAVHCVISIIAYKSFFAIDFINIAWIFAAFSLNKMISPKNEEVI